MPDDALIRNFCNLGYAAACPHLPRKRDWDAVRFSVAVVGNDQITLRFTCELDHAPVTHGTLTYELPSGSCRDKHPDGRIARLAASYVRAYRLRQEGAVA